MIIFPAIDLKDGQCVRLIKGDMDQATVFNDTPSQQGKIFQSQGFEWIHIVDLNGAFAGEPVNKESVESILDTVDIPVQLGGGIRDMETIEMWLDLGVGRVILGTAALKNPDLVHKACERFPDQIAVGIDAKGGFVATEGWAETSQVRATDLITQFERAGVAAVIYTNIDLDGILVGPDLKGTENLAKQSSIPIIASGGVGSLEDIKNVKALEESGICGVITGRALYDGRIPIEEALAIAKE
jgi:phosphoribosylformimino-5-aminoimidazole carboxamide ribotide isomerase